MRSTLNHALALLLLAATSGVVRSATIVIDDFESYPSGTNNLVKNDNTQNLGGWLRSTLNAQGVGLNQPPAPLVSGEYSGGDRRMVSAESVAAKTVAGLEDATSLSYDFSQTGTTRTYLGLWNDLNNNGVFATSEMGIQFGFQTPSGGLAAGFGFRIGNAGNLVTSGVAPVAGDWYRVTMDIGPEVSGARDLSLSVRNLTDGVDLDLNGAAAGLAFVQNFTNLEIFASATDFVPEGISVRTAGGTGFGLDNLTATVVPEPGSAVLAACALLFVQRSYRMRRVAIG